MKRSLFYNVVLCLWLQLTPGADEKHHQERLSKLEAAGKVPQ